MTLERLTLLNSLTLRIKNSEIPNTTLLKAEETRFFHWIMNGIFISVKYNEISAEKNLDCIACISQIPSPSNEILLEESKFHSNNWFVSLIPKEKFYTIMHKTCKELNSYMYIHAECITPNEENGVNLAKLTISFNNV